MSIRSGVDLTFAAATPGSLKDEINCKTAGIMNLPKCLRFLTSSEPNRHAQSDADVEPTLTGAARAGETGTSEPVVFRMQCSRSSGDAVELTVPHKTVAELR